MKLAITILAAAVLAISISNAYAQEASVSIPEGAAQLLISSKISEGFESASIPEGSALADCREDFSNDCYNPGILTINKDTTVTWTNDDNTSHTVTSGISFGLDSIKGFENKTLGPDGLFDSGIMVPGATFSHIFEYGGEYNYFCMLHPFMVGKVIVEDEDKYEYNLTLFEDGNPSDGVIDLGEPITAIAYTNDTGTVTIRWINPDNNIARVVIENLTGTSVSDTYTPNIPGTWIVEAEFSHYKIR